MNILVLFDYLYYRIAFIYDKRFKLSESKELSSVAVLSLLQFVNSLALLSFFEPKKDLNPTLGIYILIAGYLVFFVLNYIRYIKLLNFKDLEYKWGREKMTRKLINSVIIIVYILLSFYLLDP